MGSQFFWLNPMKSGPDPLRSCVSEGTEALRGYPYMREMGAICQIGVLAWKPCAFWVQNGFFFGLFALRFQ